jgi:hypothetical protein
MLGALWAAGPLTEPAGATVSGEVVKATELHDAMRRGRALHAGQAELQAAARCIARRLLPPEAAVVRVDKSDFGQMTLTTLSTAENTALRFL